MVHDLVIKTTKDSQFQHPSTFSRTVTCELFCKLFSPDNHEKWVQNPLLLPANEVWGKVMFLHLCVILFMGGGVGVSVPAYITGHITGASLYRGSLSKGGLCPGVSVQGSLCPEGVSVHGVSVQRGSLSRGSLSRRVSVRETPPTVTSGRQASCWTTFLLNFSVLEKVDQITSVNNLLFSE